MRHCSLWLAWLSFCSSLALRWDHSSRVARSRLFSSMCCCFTSCNTVNLVTLQMMILGFSIRMLPLTS